MIPPPASPVTGPQVQHEIALADDLRIVLDPQRPCSPDPSGLENSNQTVIVPGMKADARFVQDIEGVLPSRRTRAQRVKGHALDLPSGQGADWRSRVR